MKVEETDLHLAVRKVEDTNLLKSNNYLIYNWLNQFQELLKSKYITTL